MSHSQPTSDDAVHRFLSVFSVVPCAELTAYHAEGRFNVSDIDRIVDALDAAGYCVRTLPVARVLMARRGPLLLIVDGDLRFALTRVPREDEISLHLDEIDEHLVRSQGVDE